ncbi:Os02g0809401 [Oryza sativa Japonica Group]|uniref:Os02g0809401 protein n=1 Tax=Oryza sativa subsp. japonica TaxID=39947 RepID=C7IZ60_ORYSJ|nr:Os02g0809401 [Oryza sativa Japonica Group]|eukprot:NP_001173198.1 Os02g0809401 [Oryza sativa Japonica Group]
MPAEFHLRGRNLLVLAAGSRRRRPPAGTDVAAAGNDDDLTFASSSSSPGGGASDTTSITAQRNAQRPRSGSAAAGLLPSPIHRALAMQESACSEMGDDHVYAKARSRGGCFLSTAREEKQLRELCVIHRVSDSIITIHRWLCRRLSKTCP